MRWWTINCTILEYCGDTRGGEHYISPYCTLVWWYTLHCNILQSSMVIHEVISTRQLDTSNSSGKSHRQSVMKIKQQFKGDENRILWLLRKKISEPFLNKELMKCVGCLNPMWLVQIIWNVSVKFCWSWGMARWGQTDRLTDIESDRQTHKYTERQTDL